MRAGREKYGKACWIYRKKNQGVSVIRGQQKTHGGETL